MYICANNFQKMSIQQENIEKLVPVPWEGIVLLGNDFLEDHVSQWFAGALGSAKCLTTLRVIEYDSLHLLNRLSSVG